jgi:hypothetical protein
MKDEIDSLLFFLAFIRRERNKLLVISLSLTSRHISPIASKIYPKIQKIGTGWHDTAREVISVMVLMGECDRCGRGDVGIWGGFYSLVWAGADHRRAAGGTECSTLQKLGPA